MQPKKLVNLALFLALATVLYVVEAVYLPPLPIPGAKLGLSNVVTLILLVLYGWQECFFNAIARTLLGSLITGLFLTPAFYFSLGGALVSTVIMIWAYSKFYGPFSLVGVSLLGSTSHNLTQLFLAVFLYNHWGVFLGFPFLILIAVASGTFNGVVANYASKRLLAIS